MPQTKPIEIFRSRDVAIKFTVTDELFQPVDLTDKTFSFSVADGNSEDEFSLSKTTDDGIVIVDAEAGMLEVSIAGSDTDDTQAYICRYELSDTTGGGNGVVFSGTLYILESV